MSLSLDRNIDACTSKGINGLNHPFNKLTELGKTAIYGVCFQLKGINGLNHLFSKLTELGKTLQAYDICFQLKGMNGVHHLSSKLTELGKTLQHTTSASSRPVL